MRVFLAFLSELVVFRKEEEVGIQQFIVFDFQHIVFVCQLGEVGWTFHIYYNPEYIFCGFPKYFVVAAVMVWFITWFLQNVVTPSQL